MSLDINNRVFATDPDTGAELSDKPAVCMWFARCTNPANGVRDAGPVGIIPICQRCDDRVARM